MKTYYYSISKEITRPLGWDSAPQYSFPCESWQEFISHLYFISHHFGNVTIRGCQTQGYNNNGTYVESTI
jgi:hypothetical protein